MNRMKRLIGLLTLLVGLLAGLVGPQDAQAQDKVATTGLQFLKIGVSPRADGMGGAFAAIADDASAVYYNPAGLVQLDHPQLMLSYIDYPVGISYSFVGMAIPLRAGGVLGLGYYGLDAGDIPRTDYAHPFGDGTTFGAKDYALTMSYGRYLTDRFSVGLTFKLIDELLETERASGWAADVGTSYNTGFRNFRIIMVISNFGPNLRHIEEDFPLPIDFRFGGAIDIIDGPNQRATLTMEGSHPADNRERYSAGLEYAIAEKAFLRFGDRFERDIGGISFGGGLYFNLSESVKARVDYSYQDFKEFNKIQRFSLTLDF